MAANERGRSDGCDWILEQSDASIRRLLRSLTSGGPCRHPLLDAAFVTARLGAGRNADSAALRWRILAEVVQHCIEHGVAVARGDEAPIDYRALLSLSAPEQVATVLDDVCAAGGARLRGWSSLLVRYGLGTPDTFDVVDAAWVHRRTFQRWLSLGYGLLRDALADLEREAIGGTPTSRAGRRHAAAAAIGPGEEAADWLARLRRSAPTAALHEHMGCERSGSSLAALLEAADGPVILLHGPPGQEQALVLGESGREEAIRVLDGTTGPFAVLVPLSGNSLALPTAS